MQKILLQGSVGEDVVAQDFYLKAAGTAYAAAQLVPLPTKEAGGRSLPVAALPETAPFSAEVARTYLADHAAAVKAEEEEDKARAERAETLKVLDEESSRAPKDAGEQSNPKGKGKGKGPDAKITQMQELTQAPRDVCQRYLARENGVLDLAVRRYFEEANTPTSISVMVEGAGIASSTKEFQRGATVWDLYCFAHQKAGNRQFSMRYKDQVLGERDFGTTLENLGFNDRSRVTIVL